jgi:hypothetical protein
MSVFRRRRIGKRTGMELSRQIPPGAVPADDLADLLADRGPFLTVRLTLSPAEVDAPRRGELTWASLREGAEQAGADPAALDAIDDLVEAIATREPGFVAVASPTGLLAVEIVEPSWPSDAARWQRLPWFAPVVEARQSAIDHAVVRIDRTGADIDLVVSGSVDEEITIKGRTHHIRKVGAGGWSQRRYQERAEEAWKANADEAVERIVGLLRDGDVEVALVGGEPRSTALVDEALPDEMADRLVPIQATRAADGSEEIQDESIRRALADAVARQTVTMLRELREAVGQDRAVVGGQPTLEALARSQAAVVLASDGDDETPLRGVDGEAATIVEQLLAELGEGADEVPLVDAACWAALRSGAGVRSVPAHAVDGTVAALLRWE